MANLLAANPSVGTVTPSQPQTTVAKPESSAPFNRVSFRSSQLGPTILNAAAFGAVNNTSMKAVPGYLHAIRFDVVAAGGANATTNTVGAAADAPYNAVSRLTVRDPGGTQFFDADGYMWYLNNKYTGQVGILGSGDSSKVPSFSNFSTGAATTDTGDFTWSPILPIALRDDGYCALAADNASAQSDMQVTLAAATAVYSTSPSTVPTITVKTKEQFWVMPAEDPTLSPVDLGSSAQFFQKNTETFNSGFQQIRIQGINNWVHTLILVLRDANNVRQDNWPTDDLQLVVDGFVRKYESLNERADIMYNEFLSSRETGVIVYTFRRSLLPAVSNFDSYDDLLLTTPATNLVIQGTFGSTGTGPFTIQAGIGMLVPVGPIPYMTAA